MIETISQLDALRARVSGWKQQGLRVALVPTMGNLHAGHHALVALARQHADRVVASVFVNPTQFGPNEDFARYPRTPQADAAGLEAAGCDLLWLPEVEVMYPFGTAQSASVRVPGVSGILEGASRPGHFDGVCSVVSRLFNQVLPEVAVFGSKDYQQLAVIRQMVIDLAFPIRIIAADIVREADGLAMSSRNQYLGPELRPRAAVIRQVLEQMRQGLAAGQPRAQVEAEASARLQDAGFVPDYAVVRRADLSEPVPGEAGPQVALIAARLGTTRLIDNLQF